MVRADFRGCPVSNASPAALEAFEQSVGQLVAWRGDPGRQLARAIAIEPRFAMAHALQAYLHLSGREPRQVAAAAADLDQLRRCALNERERLHAEAIRAHIDGDYASAQEQLDAVLRAYPRDLIALHVSHSLAYLMGDGARLRDRPAQALPQWSAAVPGFHAVLAMHGFGLSECGDTQRAEEVIRRAIELNPLDARAQHAMAHVFEATRAPEVGARWLRLNAAVWSGDTFVATHGWWHLALHEIDLGCPRTALELYDGRVRGTRSERISDLIDASSLLWRLSLRDIGVGARWGELAACWEAHAEDNFCSFNDVHAMLAFAGAGRRDLAERLLRSIAAPRAPGPHYAAMNRLVGLPACKAVLAFAQGDDAMAIALLGRLPGVAHRLGGSHAQRDVLQLTLLAAFERNRLPHHQALAAA